MSRSAGSPRSAQIKTDSEAIAEPSLDENRTWLTRLAGVFVEAIDHFGMKLRTGVTVGDLACAVAGVVEGLWINQYLTTPDRPEVTPGRTLRAVRRGRCTSSCEIPPRWFRS
jgi:hypothetical protein